MPFSLCESGDATGYDHIVVGSGFAALAFIDETLRIKPRSRILCIERGFDNVGAHSQNLEIQNVLSTSQSDDVPDLVPGETVWQVSTNGAPSQHINACAGAAFLLGGRSNYWYGWCMIPELKQNRGFGAGIREKTLAPEFWARACNLLNVNTIERQQDTFLKELQHTIQSKLRRSFAEIAGAQDVQPAAFASGQMTGTRLARFSAAPKLRKLAKAGKIDLAIGHQVTCLDRGVFGAVKLIKTSQGDLILSDSAKVVLCAGTIPTALIVSNSFPHLRASVGNRMSGHFRTHVVAKLPAAALCPDKNGLKDREHWGLAAVVIRGYDAKTNREYHVQLSAFHCPKYEGRYQEIVPQLPRYGTAPAPVHLRDLGDDILISCASLGELGVDDGVFHLESVSSEEMKMHIALTENDNALWDLMDRATFDAIESLVDASASIQYWSEASRQWGPRKPLASECRSPMLVHEAGSTPVGTVVDEHFKLRGVENVYVAGSSVLPSAGSWNPTLTICALAQELARGLASSPGDRSV